MEIYRYRSITSLLDFKELENQEIYLASPEELNDPMEGMYWGFYRGNMNAWNEMFRDYFKYMFDTYMKVYDSIEHIYDVIEIIRKKCKEYNRSTFEFYQYSALGYNTNSPVYTIRLVNKKES